MQTIATLLKAEREKRGLKQKEAAAVVGVGQPAWSKWEAGSQFPDVDYLDPIAEFLGLPVSEVLRLTTTERRRRATPEDRTRLIREYMAAIEALLADQDD